MIPSYLETLRLDRQRCKKQINKNRPQKKQVWGWTSSFLTQRNSNKMKKSVQRGILCSIFGYKMSLLIHKLTVEVTNLERKQKTTSIVTIIYGKQSHTCLVNNALSLEFVCSKCGTLFDGAQSDPCRPERSDNDSGERLRYGW